MIEAGPENSSNRRSDSILISMWLAVSWCLVLAVFRLWCCLCTFPSQEWNDVRLRAAFLITDGLPLYPGLDTGPITTWMYGPMMPLLMLPATLGPTIGSAMIIAGVLNIMLLSGATAFACLLWPQSANLPCPLVMRLGVLGVLLLLLPATFFLFLQADNATLACGLVSLTCLAKAEAGNSRRWWWMAASFAGAAAFSKLHGVTVIPAEIGWVWFTCSRLRFRQFCVQLAIVCFGLTCVTLSISTTPVAAWEIMVRLPSRLPFISDWNKRWMELLPYLPLMIVLPGLLTLRVFRHRQLMSASGLGLPIGVWLASLPLGIAGTLTWGGTSNSLHGAFFLLPAALVNLCAHSLGRPWQTRFVLIGLWLTGPAMMLVFDPVNIWRLPKSPDTSLPVEAVLISSQRGNHVWLPWRPLATHFATGRHDHDEDGLYVRQLTGLFPRRDHALAGLPPVWDSTMLQVGGMNWGIAEAMHESVPLRQQLGRWLVMAQPSADSVIGNAPVKVHSQP